MGKRQILHKYGTQEGRDSRTKLEGPKDEEPEDERGLSPIEEESESAGSSRDTCSDVEDSGEEDSKRKDIEQGSKDRAVDLKNSSGEESSSEGETLQSFSFTIGPPRGHLKSDASGDNDEKTLKTTLEWLKGKVEDSAREIVALKKELSLEKSRNRQQVLQVLRYREECSKESEMLKTSLQTWKDETNGRLQSQVVRWQMDERKRINEELEKIVEDIRSSLEKDAKEWQREVKRRTSDLTKKERTKREVDAEDTRILYEKIQRHLGNLDKRNKKSYDNFRKQIDVWEERLRDEVVKLHQNDLKKIRRQLKLWYKDHGTSWYSTISLASPGKGEWQAEAQRTPKQTSRSRSFDRPSTDEDDLLKRLFDSSSKELRQVERTLKTEIQDDREELTKRIDDKVEELWVAFDELKQNLAVERSYQVAWRFQRNQVIDHLDSDSAQSDVSDKRGCPRRRKTANSGTNTDLDTDEEDAGRRPKKVSFRRNSLVEMPIVPQVRDENFRRK
ncbi:myosin-J heavy chain-like [Orussus abietinus]|uniref:myosin-J heavy chain-like n=1 Tax=Orussus abietinus TaxID=222816 RepID=UPI0006257E59|nr:myosin-J heavy chain-like [Orussus abietinus]